ncbi:hypothetical protein BP5796_03464 [Coleophoma crateriformis]|uniref:Uncharacterized protein n=1 Tax=Coleophoma crateriformis TaxID=565419 RepID=A0A3D8SN88_9HELO|nr:hypothetical protein BP5796_03464 [Coleophoma crateriformis]
MASQTASDILALRARSQPMQFLSLAPTTSSSYPATPAMKSPSLAAEKQEPALVTEANEAKIRRSSSSASSNVGGMRFLKLGPVHFGADYGNEGDWSEVVVE